MLFAPGGILLGVLSAGASAFIARAVLGEQQPEEERDGASFGQPLGILGD